MNLTPPRKVQTDDTTLSLIQDAVGKAIGDLQKIPILNGNLLQRQAVKAGVNNIPHLLGRRLLGYLVVRTHNNGSGAQPIITDNQDVNPNTDKSLQVISSDPGSIDLWVF